MSGTKPELTTMTSKGQVTIPSRLREQFDLEPGDRLMAVPTEHGIVLKKVELPTVEEFQRRVREREGRTDLSLDEISELVHAGRGEE
jgi:AbrB family looped-hinge helix DNA binding protein